MVYGSETWATKVADVQRLERNEMMMVRWMCGASLKDRKSNQELLDRLGIVCIAEIVRCGRSQDDWVLICRGRKMCNECVEEDIRRLGLQRIDAQDRVVRRNAILEKTSDPRKRGKRT